jgi:TfoX/Sxy family transcriptional regulator of competence genes
VAYDEDLAHRIRELMAAERGVTEKAMFGGLAFLVGGNMAIAASGQGGILVRADPEQSQKLIASSPAEMAVMQGRAMPGWLRVPADAAATKRQLAKWVQVGSDYARSLPAKGAKPAKTGGAKAGGARGSGTKAGGVKGSGAKTAAALKKR